jgi:hypothetical protein
MRVNITDALAGRPEDEILKNLGLVVLTGRLARRVGDACPGKARWRWPLLLVLWMFLFRSGGRPARWLRWASAR